MIIGKGQKEAFSQAANRNFELAARDHLRKELPDRVEGRSDEDLLKWIRDAILRAGAFGLKTQHQIMCFVDSEALLGERFYLLTGSEWALRILKSDQLSAQDKAGLVLATSCSVYREKSGVKA